MRSEIRAWIGGCGMWDVEVQGCLRPMHARRCCIWAGRLRLQYADWMKA